MARSRRGGKAAAKPKNEKLPEDGEGSTAVDETYVVAETDGLSGVKRAPFSIPEVKVTVEKCDAILVKHKTEESEDEDSFMESEKEDEEVMVAAAGREDEFSKDESERYANEEELVINRSTESEEFANLRNSYASESEASDCSPGEGVEEDDEDELPLRSIRPKLPVAYVQQPDASKKSKKGRNSNEPEKVSAGSKNAPVKATGTSRNPGKVASVAEKKKQGSSTSKSLGSKNTAPESKAAAASKSKEVLVARSKPVPEKTISEAKKVMILDLLMDGLSKHDERKGVSMPTIKKYVVENDLKERSWSKLQPRVREALDNALMEGKILRPKGNEHMNGLVGRFKVNKKYQTKKASKRESVEPESPPKKGVATSKLTKPSAAASNSKKQTANPQMVPPKEVKGKSSKKEGPKRRLKIFSTDDSEEEFQDPVPVNAPKTAKGNRRKSKSGDENVKANPKGPPKPKTMKRSQSAENISVPTNKTRGRPKSKK